LLQRAVEGGAVRGRQNESTSSLPEDYVLDTSEADLWILKRVDGSKVDGSTMAAFSLERAGSEALRRAADADVWG
jgi:hypothetical protein